jgi:Zn-dependent peptidase ImmA (M78 family)
MFRRWRDLVEVSWGQRRLAGQPDYFRFLAGEGFARLPVANVAQPLYAVLRQSADYLLSLSPDSQRFLNLRDGLESLSRHHTTKRLALLAGIGTTVEDQERRWDEMIALNSKKPQAALDATFSVGIEQTELYLAGSCQGALMFGSLSPTIDAGDAVALAGKLIDLYSPGSESSQLRELVREEVISDSRQEPWAQGYSLAEDLLEELSLPEDSDDWIDVHAIYARLGIDIDEFFLKDRGIRAVSVAGPDHRPSTLLNPDHPTYLGEPGQRFTLAHELCHILFDRSYGARLAIASGPWAPSDVEARANAFAAMLLMPTDLVRRLVRSLENPVNSVEGIRAISDRMQTSFKATLEHLKNLNFLNQEEHDWIEMQ